jgi:hypothetical protein
MIKLYGEKVRPQAGAAQALQSIVKETIDHSPTLSNGVRVFETKVKTEIDSFKKRTTETTKMFLDVVEHLNMKKSN